MGLWATCPSGKCPWKQFGIRWLLRSLSIQDILWFSSEEAMTSIKNLQLRQDPGRIRCPVERGIHSGTEEECEENGVTEMWNKLASTHISYLPKVLRERNWKWKEIGSKAGPWKKRGMKGKSFQLMSLSYFLSVHLRRGVIERLVGTFCPVRVNAQEVSTEQAWGHKEMKKTRAAKLQIKLKAYCLWHNHFSPNSIANFDSQPTTLFKKLFQLCSACRQLYSSSPQGSSKHCLQILITDEMFTIVDFLDGNSYFPLLKPTCSIFLLRIW